MNAIPIESIEPIETPWPEFGDVLALPELALACAMSLPELHELIEYGALCPIAQPPAEPVFALNCLEPLRKAVKLRRDYDLDLFVVVIVMDFIRHIDALEAQLRAMQASSMGSET